VENLTESRGRAELLGPHSRVREPPPNRGLGGRSEWMAALEIGGKGQDERGTLKGNGNKRRKRRPRGKDTESLPWKDHARLGC